MAFRRRMFKARPMNKLAIDVQVAHLPKTKKVNVVSEESLRKVFRAIDYDLSTRERAQRYQRRTERFCRA